MTELVQTHSLLKWQINWNQGNSDVGRVRNEKQFGVFYRPGFLQAFVALQVCVFIDLFLSSHLLAYGYLPVFRKNKVCSSHKSYIADRFGPVCLPCHLTAELTWLLAFLPPQDYILHFFVSKERRIWRGELRSIWTSGSFLLFPPSESRAVSWTALNLAANFHFRSLFCLDFG